MFRQSLVSGELSGEGKEIRATTLPKVLSLRKGSGIHHDINSSSQFVIKN